MILWGFFVLLAPFSDRPSMARLAHAGAFVLLNYLWAKRFSSNLRVG
jgi:hypothetical protein